MGPGVEGLVPERLPVVGDHDHHGLVEQSSFAEPFEQDADLLVHERDLAAVQAVDLRHVGGIVLALAIAFGWGGRELARDFLERLYRRKKEDEEGGGDGISHL